MLKYVVENEMMPPWPADAHYAQYANNLSLTKDEKEKIILWIDAGCPKGVGDNKLPEFENSFYGKPDMRIDLPKIDLHDGSDRERAFRVPLSLPENMTAQCIEIMPSSSGRLKTAWVDVILLDESRKEERISSKEILQVKGNSDDELFQNIWSQWYIDSRMKFLGAVARYLPGSHAPYYPDQLGGIELGKSNYLIVHLSYQPIEETFADSTSINIFFKNAPATRNIYEMHLGIYGSEIATSTSNYMSMDDISLLSVAPALPDEATSFHAFAYSEKDTIPLLFLPKWMPDWQFYYTFAKPLKVPRGYTIVAQPEFQPSIDEKKPFRLYMNYMLYEKGDEHISLSRDQD